MTLMPVSNTSRFGSSASNPGASRWMSQWSSILSASSSGMSSGWPITLVTWPSTPSPTGMVRPVPRLRTSVPRVRPSVGLRQMARTRDSPICWATSARTSTPSPSTTIVISSAVLIAGTASGGNSTSTTGPAMATILPGLGDAPAPVSLVVSVTVMSGGSCWSDLGGGEAVDEGVGGPEGVVDEDVPARDLGGPHGLGTADDLHDLGGDGVLPGPVHGPAVLDDEVLGVVGGRLHRPLLGGEERRRALEHGGVQPRLGVAGQQALEDLGGVGLELVVALGPVGGLLEHGGVERHEPADDDPLGGGRQELGVGDLDQVVVAPLE